MAIGSGLASQLGAKKETTYGTRVVPDKFFEYSKESVKLTRNRIYSKGLRAGRTFQRSSRVATPTRAADGSVEFEVVNKGMGFWFDLLTGDAVTPVQQAATTAYLSTFNIGNSDPSKSATVQVGKPGAAGTVHPFDYLGAMVTEAKLSCEVDGFLEAEFGLDVRDRKTDQSLASASYPSSLESFHFAQCTPTVNGNPITDVFDSVDISIALARKTDRFHLGSAGLKTKPIQNDYGIGSIEFGGDFKDLTFANLYDADTIFPIVVLFEGSTIEAAHKFYIRVTAAACQLEGEDPTVEGPDVLSQGLTAKILDDGTNPPVKVEIMSTDTAAW